MAAVQLIPAAAQDVRDLDGSAQVLVMKALKKLKSHPEQRGQALGSNATGNLSTFRKLVAVIATTESSTGASTRTGPPSCW